MELDYDIEHGVKPPDAKEPIRSRSEILDL